MRLVILEEEKEIGEGGEEGKKKNAELVFPSHHLLVGNVKSRASPRDNCTFEPDP